MVVDWIKAQQRADRTGRWAVTMAKVRRLHKGSCRRHPDHSAAPH